MKKGFTLVELSIVLVIIGLLTGGVLVGQSLIAGAKIGSFVRQIQQFDIAASNFKNKYKQLPGDTKLFSGSIGPGNNDGYIRCCGGGWNDDVIQGEVLNYWYHLSLSGELKEHYTYINATSGLIADTHMPEMVIQEYGSNVGIFVGQEREFRGINFPFPNDVNFYWISDYPKDTNSVYTGCGGGTCKRPFSAETMLAVDHKIDDDYPDTGNVRWNGIKEFDYSGAGSDFCFTYSGGKMVYNVNHTGNYGGCSMVIKHLSQVGQ